MPDATSHLVTSDPAVGRPWPVASPGFAYASGELRCRGVPVNAIGEAVGTPVYVYDLPGVAERARSVRAALACVGAEVCFAVKACTSLAVLRTLAGEGVGMDVVSGGELERAWLAGVPMDRVTFAGVAKGEEELRAALDGRHSPLAGGAGRALCGRDPEGRGRIGLINVESASEMALCAAVGRELGVAAPVAVRVNPGVTAGANAKVRVGSADSKFGVTPAEAVALARRAHDDPDLDFLGLHLHLGSQIGSIGPFDDAYGVLAGVMDELERAGVPVRVFDAGAGLAVSYMGEPTPTDDEWGRALGRRFAGRVGAGMRVIVEPGRELVAQAGVLVTRVRHVKRTGGRTFVITDAGLNALVRPAMYGARHFIWPAAGAPGHGPDPVAPPPWASAFDPVDVVGPVCESSDVLIRDWRMPPVERGDLLAVFTAGAYGMSMAMPFNDLPLPAEVAVDDAGARVTRERAPLARLFEADADGAGGRLIAPGAHP